MVTALVDDRLLLSRQAGLVITRIRGEKYRRWRAAAVRVTVGR